MFRQDRIDQRIAARAADGERPGCILRNRQWRRGGTNGLGEADDFLYCLVLHPQCNEEGGNLRSGLFSVNASAITSRA